MLSDLQTLINLQGIDTQLYQLERAKGDLPRKVKELDDRLAQSRVERQKKLDTMATVAADRRSTEGALEMLRERRKKFDSQLLVVTTNREYDAVTIEIESADLEIDNGETRVLELIDREEKLQKELVALDEQIAQIQGEYDQQHAILQARLAESRSHQEGLQAERERLAAMLKPPVLSSYTRILRGKDGVALVQVVRGSCTGCNSRIPPQRAMEIREMDRIILCESCGRILVPAAENAVPA